MAAKRRRANGEGAVYRPASDGLWVGMLDLGIVDGRRRRKTVYGQTEREALQKLSTLRAAHDRGIDLLVSGSASPFAVPCYTDLTRVRPT